MRKLRLPTRWTLKSATCSRRSPPPRLRRRRVGSSSQPPPLQLRPQPRRRRVGSSQPPPLQLRPQPHRHRTRNCRPPPLRLRPQLRRRRVGSSPPPQPRLRPLPRSRRVPCSQPACPAPHRQKRPANRRSTGRRAYGQPPRLHRRGLRPALCPIRPRRCRSAATRSARFTSSTWATAWFSVARYSIRSAQWRPTIHSAMCRPKWNSTAVSTAETGKEVVVHYLTYNRLLRVSTFYADNEYDLNKRYIFTIDEEGNVKHLAW